MALAIQMTRMKMNVDCTMCHPSADEKKIVHVSPSRKTVLKWNHLFEIRQHKATVWSKKALGYLSNARHSQRCWANMLVMRITEAPRTSEPCMPCVPRIPVAPLQVCLALNRAYLAIIAGMHNAVHCIYVWYSNAWYAMHIIVRHGQYAYYRTLLIGL